MCGGWRTLCHTRWTRGRDAERSQPTPKGQKDGVVKFHFHEVPGGVEFGETERGTGAGQVPTGAGAAGGDDVPRGLVTRAAQPRTNWRFHVAYVHRNQQTKATEAGTGPI